MSDVDKRLVIFLADSAATFLQGMSDFSEDDTIPDDKIDNLALNMARDVIIPVTMHMYAENGVPEVRNVMKALTDAVIDKTVKLSRAVGIEPFGGLEQIFELSGGDDEQNS